ncbi:MAG: N-acetyl-alpha-D-glucosaminyl L-malate synthase BshA [Candidatus Doudnabacteria bacterium]|nr:N-acetyl-alpha-D-glucosaminyl L-malate synthase BshA [Candidatus Doudnabacteria bacterium]
MGKNLKIGIVCYPSVGGSGIVATNLGNELARLGHKVHFISYDAPFRLDLKAPNILFHKVSINSYNLFKYPDYTLPLAVTIEQVQRKYNLDVVHVHYAVPHATAALLARRIMRQNNTTLPKIVTTLHGTDITLLAHDKSLFDIIKYSIERSHCVTAVSESLKRDTIRILKTEKPIEVIYNFYTPVPPDKSRRATRRGLKVKDTDFLAIHLSNLRPVKRIPDLLKVAARLKHRRNFKLLILAGEPFSPYKPLMKKLRLGNVIVRENIKDIQNFLNAADVGVYTSQDESFGMGMLETMSYGKPVLATNTGGVPEVMRDGKDGYLLKVGDVKGFAKKLDLLISNPVLTAELGQNAQTRAHEKFSAGVIVNEYIKHYTETCGKK